MKVVGSCRLFMKALGELGGRGLSSHSCARQTGGWVCRGARYLGLGRAGQKWGLIQGHYEGVKGENQGHLISVKGT